MSLCGGSAGSTQAAEGQGAQCPDAVRREDVVAIVLEIPEGLFQELARHSRHRLVDPLLCAVRRPCRGEAISELAS